VALAASLLWWIIDGNTDLQRAGEASAAKLAACGVYISR
jgi:hypothetical protein